MKAPSIAPSMTTWPTWTPFGPSSRARALRQRPKPVLRAGEGREAGGAAHARGRAGEEDRAPAARSHHARRLAARQEAGEAGHLPDLGIDLGRRLEHGKTHVGADVEDEDLDRPDRLLDRRDEGGDVGFVARIEPEGVRFAAAGADALEPSPPAPPCGAAAA